jgi:hypothetical protein
MIGLSKLTESKKSTTGAPYTRKKLGTGAIVLAFAIAAAANARGAGTGTATITLLSEFDYPSTGASTQPHDINNASVIVGTVVFPDSTQAASSSPPRRESLSN